MTVFKYKFLGRDTYINLDLITWLFFDNSMTVTLRSHRGEQQLALNEEELARLKCILNHSASRAEAGM